MSTPDSGLSPQERAAFANLEAAAAADDPQLAARMRAVAAGRAHARTFAPRLAAYLVGRWRVALRRGWWGVPIAFVGLALTVISMSTSVLVGVLGLVVSAAGLRLVGEAVRFRLIARSADHSV